MVNRPNVLKKHRYRSDLKSIYCHSSNQQLVIFILQLETDIQVLDYQPKISPLAWILPRILIQIQLTKTFFPLFTVLYALLDIISVTNGKQFCCLHSSGDTVQGWHFLENIRSNMNRILLKFCKSAAWGREAKINQEYSNLSQFCKESCPIRSILGEGQSNKDMYAFDLFILRLSLKMPESFWLLEIIQRHKRVIWYRIHNASWAICTLEKQVN